MIDQAIDHDRARRLKTRGNRPRFPVLSFSEESSGCEVVFTGDLSFLVSPEISRHEDHWKQQDPEISYPLQGLDDEISNHMLFLQVKEVSRLPCPFSF